MRRRTVLQGAGAGVAGLLAGCTSPISNDAGSGGGSYTVSMEPVGETTLDGVPETWLANNGSYADMGAALGVEPPKALYLKGRYHTQYYDGIPGVNVDKSGMKDLWLGSGLSKELFHSLDADVHVMDPNFIVNRSKWKQSDVDDIADNVAPFFANSIFSTGYEWHKDYPYYSLYEAFEKVAQLFQRTDRYDAFADLHDEFQSKVSETVPPESERPSVAVLWASGNEPKSFSPYLIGEGTSFKQWRDLEVRDALAETDVKDFHSSRAAIDFETLLKIDPDVLLLRGHENQTAQEFQDTVVQFLKGNTTASKLTAVKNGDVYRGGPLYQGPITNLVLTERAAKQVYDVEQALFDRQRVSDIVNGDF